MVGGVHGVGKCLASISWFSISLLEFASRRIFGGPIPDSLCKAGSGVGFRISVIM